MIPIVYLGSKLKELRKQKGLSQGELAERLNITRQAISKWESDISQPDLNNLIEICKIFGISFNELLEINPLEAHLKKDDVDNAILKKNAKKTHYRRNSIVCISFSFIIFLCTYILTICNPELRVAENYEIMHIWEIQFWMHNNLFPLFLLWIIGLICGIVYGIKCFFVE